MESEPLTGMYGVKIPISSIKSLKDGSCTAINGSNLLLVDDKGREVKGQCNMTIKAFKDEAVTINVDITVGAFVSEGEGKL